MSSDATRTQSTTAKIAPWLAVADATRAVEYYRAAFGAIELERLEDDLPRGPARLAVRVR